MKRQEKQVGAVDKIAEWRRAGELLRAELVATRDRLARELEEAENALCELDGRPVAIEKHLKREPKSPFGSSPWLPLGPGWGAPDENGLAKHLSCNGKGCEDCKRQGVGRCKLRARAA